MRWEFASKLATMKVFTVVVMNLCSKMMLSGKAFCRKLPPHKGGNVPARAARPPRLGSRDHSHKVSKLEATSFRKSLLSPPHVEVECQHITCIGNIHRHAAATNMVMTDCAKSSKFNHCGYSTYGLSRCHTKVTTVHICRKSL